MADEKDDSGWRTKLQTHADESVRLFSEPGRPERERAPVAEFLTCFGVPFSRDELSVQRQDDDVDVRFRDARFQNVEAMDSDRRRQDEFKKFAEKVRRVRDDADLEVPMAASVPMNVPDVVAVVTSALTMKKQNRLANRANLDALVYVNLRGRHLYPVPVAVEDARATERLGWRSVSVLFWPYAIVLCAAADAPAFLRERAGTVRFGGIDWKG